MKPAVLSKVMLNLVGCCPQEVKDLIIMNAIVNILCDLTNNKFDYVVKDVLMNQGFGNSRVSRQK